MKDRGKSIHDMRMFIRREETAIRGNGTVFKKLWTFIEGIVDGSFAPTSKPKGARGKKRKDADDEDGEYAPGKKGKTKLR